MLCQLVILLCSTEKMNHVMSAYDTLHPKEKGHFMSACNVLMFCMSCRLVIFLCSTCHVGL